MSTSGNTFKVAPYLINGQHRISVGVVGAGGTGSLVITKLARLHQALLKLDHPGLYVHIIDPDMVEEHNVGRQMFNEGDVGYFKAESLCRKVNFAFGTDWECEHKLFEDATNKNFNITISCVDNVKARKQVIDQFYEAQSGYVEDIKRKFYLVDCGNNRDQGQVILSDTKRRLKCMDDLVPNWSEQDTEEEQGVSCSYIESLQEQDLFINDWVSLFAVNIIKDLLFNKEIDYQGVFFNATESESAKLRIHGAQVEEEV